MVTTGLGAAGGGTLVAVKPSSPVKMNRVTLPRFSPAKTTSAVVPRWIHSGEMELSLGMGWAGADAATSKAATSRTR